MAEDPVNWMGEQQRFFRETLNTDLAFFGNYDEG